jgi:hypothetical protein
MMGDSTPTRSEKNKILLIEDAAHRAGVLGSALGDAFRIEAVSASTELPSGHLRDSISARRRLVDGNVSLLSNDGDVVDVIGLNANLARLAGDNVRRDHYYGVGLLEWIRRELRLNTTVVLWSFLSLDALRKTGARILHLKEGLIYLRLPASLAHVRRTFEHALTPGAALRRELLEEALASLYGEDSRTDSPPVTGDGRLKRASRESVFDLRSMFFQVYPQLASALAALGGGDAGQIQEFLAGRGWSDFIGLTDEVEKSHRREGLMRAELEEVVARAININSFRDWWDSNPGAGSESLTQAAAFYQTCAQILHDNLLILTAPPGDGAR